MKITGKMMGRRGRLRVILNYLMYETLNKTWDTKTNDSRANQSSLRFPELNSTRRATILAKIGILWELKQWNRLPNDSLFHFSCIICTKIFSTVQKQPKIPISDELFTSVNLITVCFTILVKIIKQSFREVYLSKLNIIMLGCNFYVQQGKN